MMINTWNVASIRDYKQAHEYFESTRYPARSKKWFDHQRPLRNTSSPHLRIERGEYNGHKFYDLCLYQTSMVRYYEPNDAGEEAVWLLNHYSNSSQRFLWNAGWHNRKRLVKQNGDEFALQLSGQASVAQKLWGDSFTCKLVFDSHGKVIAEKSVHIPFTRRASTDTRRAKRKQMRENLTPIFDMLEMQYQSFIDGIVIEEHDGRPFASRNYGVHISEDIKQRWRKGGYEALTPDDLTVVVSFATDCCRNIAKNIVNRRAYNYHNYDTGGRLSYDEYNRRKDMLLVPVNEMPLTSHMPEVIARLTPTWDDIKKAVETDLMCLAGLANGDELTPYPQLAKTYAKQCYNLRVEDWNDLSNALGIETYGKLVNRKGVVY